MSRQISQNQIQDKNEKEVSKAREYAQVYCKMVSQMAKNSQDGCL